MSKNVHRWTRLSSIKWQDAWEERLRFLGPERVVFLTWPNSRALKIEAYCDGPTARRLVRHFAGKQIKLDPQVLTGAAAAPRPPLAIRGKLRIHSDEAAWRADAKNGRALFIPLGMAFGTGEHATTATCLRFLCDLAPKLPPDFPALDLGTGSGILALAMEALGATSVDALDYDPAAVRIAKQNARTNKCRHIQVAEADVLKFTAKNRYVLVTANLFSEVLIAASQRIARSLKPGGWLIFSGVLRTQAAEVVTAFQRCGFTKPRLVARGKWCAGICQKKA